MNGNIAALIITLIVLAVVASGSENKPVQTSLTAASDAQPERRQPPRRRDQVTEIPEHAVEITLKDGYRLIESNGIPEHTTGDFPNRNNPNAISGQTWTFRIPAEPAPNDTFTPMIRQPFGVALNGVPFDPGTAEAFNNDPSTGWNIEAFNSFFNLGLDDSNAHVQPNGAYHYHGIPTALLENLKASTGELEMVLLGYAADGYPIYNAVGHEDPENPDSPLIELKSSYTLKTEPRPGGSRAPSGRPNGDYTQDWQFVEGHAQLDEANAYTGPTPEYPDGTYYYCLTEAYPYVPRQWKGTPDPSFSRGGAGQGNGQRSGRRENTRSRPGRGG